MSDFASVADVLNAIAGLRFERLSDVDRADCDDVLEAAAAWARGELPLEVFATVGTIPSPHTKRPSAGYTRYVTTTSTPPSDPRRADLLRAIDALLDYQGLLVMRSGLYEPAEVTDIPIKFRHPEGTR